MAPHYWSLLYFSRDLGLLAYSHVFGPWRATAIALLLAWHAM